MPTVVTRAGATSTISSGVALPSQLGHADEALFTDGASAEWRPVPDGLPDQTGHGGEYLTTDGTTASWDAVSGGGNSAGALLYLAENYV